MEAVSKPTIGQDQAKEVKTREFLIKPNPELGQKFMRSWLSALEEKTGASIVSQEGPREQGTLKLTVTAGTVEIIERVRDTLKAAKLLL